MKITQHDIDSLADKLNALADEEKLALRVLVAGTVDDEVVGFGQPRERPAGLTLPFEKVEWVWKAPAGTEAVGSGQGKSLLDYDWIG